jgi:colanic acid biosynthesis glycosyl transferase WcaI
MNILLLNQFFWPDASPTSVLLTDLARHLSALGHEITVVCGSSSYAEGDGSCAPAVRILRVTNFPFARGTAARLLSYGSFFTKATWHALRLPRSDMILTLTTPPLLPVIGTFAKRLRGGRHFIWEMDVYPDVAIDVGKFQRDSWPARFIGKIADYARRHADGVIALGACMGHRLAARGVSLEKIRVAENWADGDLIRPQPHPDKGPLRILYSGNFGLAHDVNTVCSTMECLKGDDRFHFSFIGAGTGHVFVEQFCRTNDVSNASFSPYCHRDQLAESLGAGDIGLVTQLAATVGSVVSSKVYALMAAAKPVLFIGPGSSTTARLIERFSCGWHVECGDSSSAVQLLKHLAEHPELIREAGRRAHEAFVGHYDRPAGVSRICTILGVGDEPPVNKPIETHRAFAASVNGR